MAPVQVPRVEIESPKFVEDLLKTMKLHLLTETPDTLHMFGIRAFLELHLDLRWAWRTLTNLIFSPTPFKGL